MNKYQDIKTIVLRLYCFLWILRMLLFILLSCKVWHQLASSVASPLWPLEELQMSLHLYLPGCDGVRIFFLLLIEKIKCDHNECVSEQMHESCCQWIHVFSGADGVYVCWCSGVCLMVIWVSSSLYVCCDITLITSSVRATWVGQMWSVWKCLCMCVCFGCCLSLCKPVCAHSRSLHGMSNEFGDLVVTCCTRPGLWWSELSPEWQTKRQRVTVALLYENRPP